MMKSILNRECKIFFFLYQTSLCSFLLQLVIYFKQLERQWSLFPQSLKRFLISFQSFNFYCFDLRIFEVFMGSAFSGHHSFLFPELQLQSVARSFITHHSSWREGLSATQPCALSIISLMRTMLWDEPPSTAKHQTLSAFFMLVRSILQLFCLLQFIILHSIDAPFLLTLSSSEG